VTCDRRLPGGRRTRRRNVLGAASQQPERKENRAAEWRSQAAPKGVANAAHLLF
jgi:hypothetical protein